MVGVLALPEDRHHPPSLSPTETMARSESMTDLRVRVGGDPPSYALARAKLRAEP